MLYLLERCASDSHDAAQTHEGLINATLKRSGGRFNDVNDARLWALLIMLPDTCQYLPVTRGDFPCCGPLPLRLLIDQPWRRRECIAATVRALQ